MNVKLRGVEVFTPPVLADNRIVTGMEFGGARTQVHRFLPIYPRRRGHFSRVA